MNTVICSFELRAITIAMCLHNVTAVVQVVLQIFSGLKVYDQLRPDKKLTSQILGMAL